MSIRIHVVKPAGVKLTEENLMNLQEDLDGFVISHDVTNEMTLADIKGVVANLLDEASKGDKVVIWSDIALIAAKYQNLAKAEGLVNTLFMVDDSLVTVNGDFNSL